MKTKQITRTTFFILFLIQLSFCIKKLRTDRPMATNLSVIPRYKISKNKNMKRLPVQKPNLELKSLVSRLKPKSNKIKNTRVKTVRTNKPKKAKIVRKNHVKRVMAMKRQNLNHRRDTKTLFRESEVLGKKMMLAVQKIENLPTAGK